MLIIGFIMALSWHFCIISRCFTHFPVLCSSGPMWWSSCFSSSPPGDAVPFGCGGLFLFICQSKIFKFSILVFYFQLSWSLKSIRGHYLRKVPEIPKNICTGLCQSVRDKDIWGSNIFQISLWLLHSFRSTIHINLKEIKTGAYTLICITQEIHTKKRECDKPEMEHFWGVQSELWGPIHQEAGQSLDQGTHLSLRGGLSGLWPYKPHHGKSI